MKKWQSFLAASLWAAVFLLLGSISVHSALIQEETQIKPKEIIISPSTLGAVTFPHKLHFDDLEIECATCHHETNAARLEMPHENYYINFRINCRLCHKMDGTTATQAQSCSNCHLESPESSADEDLSAKVVIHKHCWECHEINVGAKAGQGCIICHIKDPASAESSDIPASDSLWNGES